MRRSLSLFALLFVPLVACAAAQQFGLLNAYEITLASTEQKDTTVTDVAAKVDARGNEARLLSAFFGLDNGLPRSANRGVCDGAGGKDGMPAIFSHEIDITTMQAGDFKVSQASGKTGHITCVTLAPADDRGELRTVLLAGEFGGEDDEPVRVEIVGNLLSIDGLVNFKGATIDVIPLKAGPTIVMAEVIEGELGKKATDLRWGGGNGCPAGTTQVVNAVWAGGVTKPGGDEADDVERMKYDVKIRRTDGSEVEVTPFALADLGDGDNNHRLCLDVPGTPVSVSFPAGFLTDPRDDPNPETTMTVTPRTRD